MPFLHNRVNRRELQERMKADKTPRVTLSFYRYFHIQDPEAYRDARYAEWDALGVLGRVYVAYEGMNGQISVPEHNVEAFRACLEKQEALKGIRLNVAVEDDGKSFFHLRVKVREKILADGLNDETFDVTNRGKHLDAKEFNALASDPETVIIDMRNHYETEVGHFKNAICPDVDTFRDSLPIIEDMLEPHRDKNILMYCTGGIRCEKASAYFKHKGFPNVHQLNGGIIKYAHEVEEQGLENRFIGKNFVFDDRLAERISDDIIAHCHQCGKPADTHTNCANVGCNLLFIQCEECAEAQHGCCSDECKEVISWPEDRQKAWRRERSKARKKQKIFHKGRGLKLRKTSEQETPEKIEV